MKQNVPLKSSFRQPLRTLFLILLIGMTSFAFISNAVQYVIVQRETGRLGSYYRSIGSLTHLDGTDADDISKGADLIQNSPYLAFADRRATSSGVMQGIYTPDVELLGNDDNGMWFYGTLIDLKPIVKIDDAQTSVGYNLTFTVDEVLAGFPEDITAGKGVAFGLIFLFKDHESAISKIEAMQIGQRYLVRGWKEFEFKDDPSWKNAISDVQMRALDDDGLWYLSAPAGADVDLTTPSMVGIKNDIDILNENQHALFLTGTADMSALPEMQEDSHMFYLADGRWLNRQDDLDGKQVIVLHKEFAAGQGLKVGDSITMTLRGLKDTSFIYIQGKNKENWRSYPTYQETFEIVGLYDDVLERYTGHNLAYVPNSTLPAEVVHSTEVLYSSLYSFVLDSSQHQDAFITEYSIPLALLGLKVSFVSGNNGANFWGAVTPLRRSALFGTLIFSLVLLLTLTLVLFLYLSQRRKEYAILRAIGVSRIKANRQVILPILLMGGMGVLAGGIPAWVYALGKAAETLSKIPTPAGAYPSATLSPVILAAFCVGLLLLLAFFAWIGVKKMAHKPVLELLGRAAPARKVRKAVSSSGGTAATTVMPARPALVETVKSSTSTQLVQHGKNKSRRFIETGALVRFGWRLLGRSALKSLLTALVALGLVFALGWMQWSIERNRAEVDHLYATTVVEAEIGAADSSIAYNGGDGIIGQAAIDKMLASGFVQSVYLEASYNLQAAATVADPSTLLDVTSTLCAIDQPENYFAGMNTRDSLKYGSGWDEGLFTKVWTADELKQQGVPAVFPDSFLQTLNLKLGDRIYLTEESGMTSLYLVAGQYTPGAWQLPGGYVTNKAESILIPLSALKVIYTKAIYYSTAKFVIDPAKNRELTGFEQEMNKMISGSGAGSIPLKIHFWDEQLRAVVAPMEKNLSLLQVLYPVTLAVSVLIGAGLCLLLVLLQAKDTALLRMLGVTRGRVRGLLCGEQILLSCVGVGLGLGLLSLLRQSVGAVFTGPVLMAAGLYLLSVLVGSLMGAVIVSNKKPLELLQVKE